MSGFAREVVSHSEGKYIRGTLDRNGIESFSGPIKGATEGSPVK